MSTPMTSTTTAGMPPSAEYEMSNMDLNQGRRRTQNRSIRAALMQWLVSHENNKNELKMLRHARGGNMYSDEIAGPNSSEVHTVLADVLGAEEEAAYYSNQYLRVLDFFGRRVGVSRNPDEPVDRFGERVLSMYRRARVQPRRWPYYLATLLISLLLLASLAFMIAGIKILYDDDADDDGNGYDSRDRRGGILFSLAVLLGILCAWALSYLLSRYYRNPNQQIGGRVGRFGDHEPSIGSHY